MSEEIEAIQCITVGDFCAARELAIPLEVLQSRKGLSNEIRSPRVQKLGLALAGYPGYIHPDRVQLIGGSEINYLGTLDVAQRRLAFSRLSGLGLCCIIITKGLEPPPELLEVAQRERIPILRTPALSALAVARITAYLESVLAPRMTVHGVLLDVFGLGILMLGPSGIGKSECALELLLKGHRLVADDLVEITRRGIDRLVGSGSQVLRYHMELRGLGIIDIKELFGISATGSTQTLDMAIRLEKWNPQEEYDRLGLEQFTLEYLGVSIPVIDMPVAPGRNISALVEVAARLHLLRQRGYPPSRELLDAMVPKSGTYHKT
jgi:HPr kinase/phosphorylase